MPRRVAVGIEASRLNIIIAVLEKHAGMRFYNRDVFSNVAGGLKLADPGGDLGLAMALAGSAQDMSIPSDMLIIGEVTLSGEVRPVAKLERRISEGRKFGFKRFLIAANCDTEEKKGIIRVANVSEAIKAVFN